MKMGGGGGGGARTTAHYTMTVMGTTHFALITVMVIDEDGQGFPIRASYFNFTRQSDQRWATLH